jgi:hypothetical protein
VVALVFAASCSSADTSESGPSAALIARPSSPAHITIVSPTNGQVIHSGDVPVRVRLAGAKIVQATSANVVPDEGHLHVSLDGNIVAMNFGLTDRLTDVAPGIHVVQVEFVASDHLPFDPRVIEQVTFEVRT